MAFVDKLKGIFGWGVPVPRVPREKDTPDVFQTKNPADEYHDMMETRKAKRRDRYDVYDAMDRMADVSSILNAYSEDATQMSQEHERTVWIEGDDKNTVNELIQMFDRIGVEDWVDALARDVGKYGDDFGRVVAAEKIGVTSLEWRDPRDVERIENREGVLLGYESTKYLGNYERRLQEDPKALPSFSPWDFVHWRLYREKRLPREKHRNIYGTSLLSGSDRIAKQVKILDDLLMIIRLTRSLDRRIYYVDTGRSPVEEEVRILKRWRRALKRKTYIDPAQGRFDSRFNPYAWCITGDTSISLLDGRERTVEQLLEEYGTKKTFWVYSRDPATMQIVPGKARCVGKTRLNAELVRVTLDNGESLRCTPDHRWMLRDGSYREACDLRPGDSLSPLYRKTFDGYEQVSMFGRWWMTHRLVAEHYFGDLDDLVVHHYDFDRRNNTPTNLVPMTDAEHNEISGHGWRVVNDSVELTEKRLAALRAAYPSKRRSEAMRRRWRDPGFRAKMSKAVSDSWTDPDNNRLRLEALRDRNSERYYEDPEHREKMLENLGRAPNNHEVLSVESCSETEDTYDISVDTYRNFGLTAGVFIHNSEDEFWPTKENTNSRVENISGLGNVGEMVDIDHFRDKFFGSFGAPKAYFGYEGDVNAKATLSSQSIRWARSVGSLQHAVRQGLTRLCQIHLAYKDMDTDANKFRVMMVTPSVLELLDRLEAWQVVVDVAQALAGLGETLGLDKLEWTIYILENTLWLPKQDIKKFVKLLRKSAKANQAPPPSDDSGDEEPPDDSDQDQEEAKRERLTEIDQAISRLTRQRVVYGAKESELPNRSAS